MFQLYPIANNRTLHLCQVVALHFRAFSLPSPSDSPTILTYREKIVFVRGVIVKDLKSIAQRIRNRSGQIIELETVSNFAWITHQSCEKCMYPVFFVHLASRGAFDVLLACQSAQ